LFKKIYIEKKAKPQNRKDFEKRLCVPQLYVLKKIKAKNRLQEILASAKPSK